MHGLHASTPSQFFEPEIEDELLKYQACIYPSLPPKRYETPNTSPSVSPPNCGEIVDERFKMVPIQPDFAEPMASAYGCPITMKYYGKGQTVDVNEVRKRFEKQASLQNSEQDPTSRGWGIITHGPSNNEIEGRTQIRFSYSGDIFSLESLEREYADQCLGEDEISVDKSRTHFSPIEVAPSERISPVGVDELIHEEVSQSKTQKKKKKQKNPLKIKLPA